MSLMVTFPEDKNHTGSTKEKVTVRVANQFTICLFVRLGWEEDQHGSVAM
jgi:hypothetical protein